MKKLSMWIGTGLVTVAGSTDTFTNFEVYSGSSLGDHMTGSALADSLLGQTLAKSRQPFAIQHGACSTCYQYGAICSNVSSALPERQK